MVVETSISPEPGERLYCCPACGGIGCERCDYEGAVPHWLAESMLMGDDEEEAP